MSQYVLDQAFRVEEANGVARYRVVVAGTAEASCRYPTVAGAPGAIGVTTHAQNHPQKSVTVRRMGVAPCEAAGAIAKGSRVVIADATGRIAQATSPTGLSGAAGTDNGVRYTSRVPGVAGSAIRVVHQAVGVSAPLSVAFSGNDIVISLATDSGEEAITTSAQLVTFVNTHAVLSTLIVATHEGASTGAAVPVSGEVVLTGGLVSAHIIGIAEQAATTAGDVIDVLLIP